MLGELTILEEDGTEVMRAWSWAGNEVMLRTYDEDDFSVLTTLDAGGVRALCDWLAAWLEQQEAEAGQAARRAAEDWMTRDHRKGQEVGK